uniref:LITAF domain-containing protein n=1 Tax=Oryzias melastigma TaxID=30732 RepID=A0A3B3B367_ORYME
MGGGFCPESNHTSLVLSVQTSCSVPFVGKRPQTMLFPPPCFTVGMVFLRSPSVILDMSKLPPEPSRTQCPECQQFVVTETVTSVSSVTWLVSPFVCVAGCCLIPFCSDKFKSITHKCPKCRTSISTLKKL